jgi:hypothetical protein
MSATKEKHLSDATLWWQFFNNNKKKTKSKLDFFNEFFCATAAAALHSNDVSPGTDSQSRQSNSISSNFFSRLVHQQIERPLKRTSLFCAAFRDV